MHKGQFSKGYDPRRHYLTVDDCRKGYAAAPSWIRSRIRSMYRGKKIVRKGPNLTAFPAI